MTRRFIVPEGLARTNVEVYGEPGRQWARRLPEVLAECERRWGLEIGPPFPKLSYNYAAPATRADGSAVVVKACFPGREFGTEVQALRIYDGRGAVRLLDFDLEHGLMLLERLEPGTLLATLEDDEAATSIAASVMRQLWRPAPAEHSFPTVADWGRGFARLREHYGGTTGPFPEKLVDRAQRLFAELVASSGEPVVLHGDLQHYNILASARSENGMAWLAIDPKGVIGEAEYEIGALIRNPVPQFLSWPQLDRVSSRRLDQLASELGFDRVRLRDWALAQAVLSAWWGVEDHDRYPQDYMAFVELLAEQ
jgi:streptomycin 6-kinase